MYPLSYCKNNILLAINISSLLLLLHMVAISKISRKFFLEMKISHCTKCRQWPPLDCEIELRAEHHFQFCGLIACAANNQTPGPVSILKRRISRVPLSLRGNTRFYKITNLESLTKLNWYDGTWLMLTWKHCRYGYSITPLCSNKVRPSEYVSSSSLTRAEQIQYIMVM